jgi:serine/threonine-protein phosphatase PGAM5
MASSTSRLFRHGVPAFGAVLASSAGWSSASSSSSLCQDPEASNTDGPSFKETANRRDMPFGMIPDAKGDFHKLFPRRQLWQPRVEYPLWDANWDGLQPPSTGNDDADRRRMRQVRKEGVTRHVILIRHGQYDEREKDDDKRILTELGRKQADLTGKRLREMMEGASKEFGPCRIKVVRVSNMARAKETADIIASHLPGVEYAEPDPDLNEGRPCHNVPGGRASDSTIAKTDETHARIEASFHKYLQRAPPPVIKDNEESSSSSWFPTDETTTTKTDDKEEEEPCKHEFEIIVCHANVIRYFLCRALQVPPEAWLRLCTFNCSLTYLTIRPTGTVSCRMLGDMGHIPYGMTTFSMHPGYNW